MKGENFEQEPSKSEEHEELLSRDPFAEGGYTFLKRVLSTCLETKAPVKISTGKLILEYQYQPGQQNFMEGVRILSGDDERALEGFTKCAESYDVKRGLEELGVDK